MNILFLRLRLIGDVVFTTPLLGAVRRAFPAARLSYLVESAAAPVVQNNPFLDEVIVAPRGRGLARVSADVALAGRLRRARFDVAIDLHGGPRSSWLARASGAPVRIGYNISGRAWMYTNTVHRPRDLRPRHSVENQWDLIAAIPGWPGTRPDPALDPVAMPLDPGAAARMAARLAQSGVERQHELIVMHVSAGNPFRRWPEAAFAEAAAELAADSPARRIVFSSGPSDREAANRIASAARGRLPGRGAQIIELGEFDLQELRALIERSRLFIGGDTGPLHIAATTRTPVVGIYGPTLAARSAPWRDRGIPTVSVENAALSCRPCDQRVCAPGDFRCLTNMEASRVVAAARGLLGSLNSTTGMQPPLRALAR